MQSREQRNLICTFSKDMTCREQLKHASELDGIDARLLRELRDGDTLRLVKEEVRNACKHRDLETRALFILGE